MYKYFMTVTKEKVGEDNRKVKPLSIRQVIGLAQFTVLCSQEQSMTSSRES